MFYFNNDRTRLQTVIKSNCGNIMDAPLKEVSAWYALVSHKNSKNRPYQECFLFFEVVNAVNFDWGVFERLKKSALARRINYENKLSISGGDINIYQIVIRSTARDSLLEGLRSYTSVLKNDKNVYNLYSIVRCTPSYESSELTREKQITYAESRFHHLLKAMYKSPEAMKYGEIHLNMNDTECYEFINPIIMFCLSNNLEDTVKINLENISIVDRINLCKNLYIKYIKGGFNVPLEVLMNMLLDVRTRVDVETNGLVMNI